MELKIVNINQKIKEIRKSKRYTLDMLAEKTGFTKGYLSKIERSSNVPPFATVRIISEALGIEINDMLNTKPEHPGTKNIEIVKSALEREEFQNEDSNSAYSFIPFLKEYKNRYMHPFICKINKGLTEPIRHDSEEFVYILEGSIEMRYEKKKYLLTKGDCFYFDSRLEHSFYNYHDDPAILLTVFFNYRRF